MAEYPRGIDVSNNNGAVDWGAVAASGVQFAISKASEGTYFRDGWFAENWSACAMYGLARGAYHYGVPSESAPEAEADYFLNAISLLYGDLQYGDLLALDLEDPAASGDLSEWALRWVRRVEQQVGFRPLVYTSPGYANSHALYNQPTLGQYGLWLASWGVPTPPTPPPPWRLVAIHQIGIGPAGSVPGVATACDIDRFNGSSVEQLKLYGKPAGSDVVPPGPEPEPEPPPSDLPFYNWQEPAHLQETDADCSCESAEWSLFAYQRTPDDDFIEQSMQAAGAWNPEVGLTDASGAGLAAWLNDQYGEFGYVASNQDGVSFDEVATEAATLKHPIMLGGRAFYHWVGVRNATADEIMLANPAPGWQNVYDTLSRAQWASLGSWSMVRLTHPAAEAETPPDPGPDPPPTSGYVVGPGIAAKMSENGDSPSTDELYVPGRGGQDAYSQAFGQTGARYVYVASLNRTFRFDPAA